MKHLFLIFVLVMAIVGCETTNPLCTENYCIEGEIYLKSDLEADATFDDLPGTVSEETLVNLLTVDVGEYTFESVDVTGKIDWDFRDDDWRYREDGITYLKKVILEIEADQGRFGENRIILVHLNADTVETDIDFLGTETITLTHHIGIAEFNGNIVGAPTK
jgi:hypothetical protein